MRSIPMPSRRLLIGAVTLGALVAGSLTGCANGPRIETRPVVSERGVDKSTDLRIAETALESGDTQLAASLFEKALKADPNSLRAELGFADAIYQAGDLARAGVLYAHVAATAPDDPRAQLGLARVALRERRLDDAVARYRRLVDAYPDNAVAAEGLGAALDLQGNHGQAQAVYRAALARHPEAQGLKTNLGLSLILDRHAREGANVLLDVAGLPDAPPQARENLALAYGVLGNGEAAKRILTADMPAVSAEDNLLFYRNLRARWSNQGASSDASGRVGSGGAVHAQSVPSAHISPQGTLE
ncbi:tetratricopeptide repeat protein [Trinickia acidisoli]|uniref:tetratricopeptide repeat protein n=1 Tax=Trinickia acidisoli TaxID=2767482 RepID=UPI001F5CD1E9|nr:tetratricopeptide repeat protein [Trinickia acidisoli]